MTNHNDDWLLYNASEYTVNGKTYRNLEAEVLYNHRLSEQNAADIDALEGRMDTAEDDIDALEGRMDTAEDDIDALQAVAPFRVKYNSVTGVCDKTMGEIIAAKNSGQYVFLTDDNTTNTACYTMWEFRKSGSKYYFQAFRISGDNIDPFINFLTSDQCNDDEYPTLTYSEIYEGNSIYWCTYGTTTAGEVEDAIEAGQFPVVQYGNYVLMLCVNVSSEYKFSCLSNNTMICVRLDRNTDAWSAVYNQTAQIVNNKKSTPQTNATYYPDFDYINNYVSPFIIQRNNLGVWDKTFSEIQAEIAKNIRPIELRAYIDASEYEIYKLKEYTSSSSQITFYKFADREEKQLWINDDNTTGSATYDLMPGMKITLSYDGSLNLVANKTYSEIMSALNNGIYVYLVDNGGNYANLSSAIDIMGQIRFCSVSCVSSTVTFIGYQVTSGNIWTQYNTTK